jgi:hypothetical protein
MERVEHFHSSGPSPEPLKIKVERGQKGGYAFEVSLSGADDAAMVVRIRDFRDTTSAHEQDIHLTYVFSPHLVFRKFPSEIN